MEQLLSQDEIDALLKGISDGEIETAKEGEPEAVAAVPERVCAEVFDFAKYTKGRKERLVGPRIHLGQTVEISEIGPHPLS